jgi:hypothetical protein
MGFKKKAGKEFFTDLNGLKHHWTSIVENINSNPKEQIEAIKWLMYLSAETDAAKNVASFALMVHYGARVGYKMPEGESDSTTPIDPLDNMVSGMMKHLFDKREANV